jgi:hypothetical protein
VVLGLGLSTGQLTAASFTASGVGTTGAEAARAGQPVVTDTVLTADDSPQVFARAAAARDALGFPVGAKRSGRHVKDGFQSSAYDEVAEVGASGQPLAVTQFDGDGRLLAAVRFDTPPGLGAKATSESAMKAAQRGLAATGLAVGGGARIDANTLTGGWDVHWDRVENGYAVRGDETRVHVWQDGRIQSLARVEHELAAAPGRALGTAEAQQSVAQQLGAWSSGNDSTYTVEGMDMEWVGPNAMFDPTTVAAPQAPYRLAWVANIKPSDPAAGYVRLITLYVDAGDGTVIGGDIVE